MMPNMSLIHSFSDFIESARRENWKSIALICGKIDDVSSILSDEAKGADNYQVSSETTALLLYVGGNVNGSTIIAGDENTVEKQ